MNASKKKSPLHNWRPFKEARAFVRNLGLKNVDDWKKWAKSSERPNDIPAYPNELFKDKGWVSWNDWLGTKPKKGNYRPFDEARTYVQNLGLQSRSEWRAWLKSGVRPIDIPTNPNAIYKNDGWLGWGDWLGTYRVAVFDRVYRPFFEARALVHTLNLKNQVEWIVWAKSNERPDDIPANPRGVY